MRRKWRKPRNLQKRLARPRHQRREPGMRAMRMGIQRMTRFLLKFLMGEFSRRRHQLPKIVRRLQRHALTQHRLLCQMLLMVFDPAAWQSFESWRAVSTALLLLCQSHVMRRKSKRIRSLALAPSPKMPRKAQTNQRRMAAAVPSKPRRRAARQPQEISMERKRSRRRPIRPNQTKRPSLAQRDPKRKTPRPQRERRVSWLQWTNSTKARFMSALPNVELPIAATPLSNGQSLATQAFSSQHTGAGMQWASKCPKIPKHRSQTRARVQAANMGSQNRISHASKSHTLPCQALAHTRIWFWVGSMHLACIWKQFATMHAQLKAHH